MNTSPLTETNSKLPLWLKAISVVGIIWYAFGLLQFWLSYSMDTASAVSSGAITEAHGAALDGTPILIWLAFAIASAAGLFASILLLLKSGASKVIFGISLLAAIIYYAWVYGVSGTGGDRPSEEIVIAGVVGSVTLAFFLLSRRVT